MQARRVLVLQALITAFVLGVLLWRVDVPAALRSIPRMDLSWGLPALFAFTLSKVVHALRWRVFLRRHSVISTPRLVALFLVSNLANALLPLRAGDLLRIEVPSRRYHIPRAELASSVVLVESLLDGVAFVLLIGGALMLVDLPAVLRPPLLALTAGILVTFALAVAAARAGRGWRLRGSVGRRVAEALDGMVALQGGLDVVVAVTLSCAGWLIEVTAYWLLAQSFGLALAYPEALLVTIVANLIVAVPITPWNVGPYEVALTELLVLMGIPRATASGFAIGSHIVLAVWIGVTGLIAMWALGLQLRDVTGARRAAASTGPTDAPARR
jgi:uncharacterized membrane protein YbhN (UPF0104 family)